MFPIMFIFLLVGLSSLFSEVTDFHGTLVKLIWLKVHERINCYYPFLNIFSILVATTSGTTTTTYKPKDSLETNAVATSKSNFIIALSCFLCLCIT